MNLADQPRTEAPANLGSMGQGDKAEQTKGLSFERALSSVKQGKKVAREGWNGKGMWLAKQVPDGYSKMTLPYIYIEYPEDHPAYPNGCRVPWLASQTDLFAQDWFVVE